MSLIGEFNPKHDFENSYILGPKIGEGMHSSVYKCTSKTTQEALVVKVTREDDPEKKLAHKKEFELLCKLDHPNILKAISFYENPFKGELYLVT